MPRVSAWSDQIEKYYDAGGSLEITSSIDLCRECWPEADGMTMVYFHLEHPNPDRRFRYADTSEEPWKTGIIRTKDDGCGEIAPPYSTSDCEYNCELCGCELWKEDEWNTLG